MGRSERAVSPPIIIGHHQEPVASFLGSLRLVTWPRSLIIAKVGSCLPFGLPTAFDVSFSMPEQRKWGRVADVDHNELE